MRADEIDFKRRERCNEQIVALRRRQFIVQHPSHPALVKWRESILSMTASIATVVGRLRTFATSAPRCRMKILGADFSVRGYGKTVVVHETENGIRT